MISENAVVKKFIDFTKIAAPVLFLKTDEAYEDALKMIEHLMESVDQNVNKPENLLITLLAQAIENYEANDLEISAFINEASKDKTDAVIVRFILDQHHLKLSDLPEIGHKSLVSKILSGERNLTKSHITKLSKRFNLNPAIFF